MLFSPVFDKICTVCGGDAGLYGLEDCTMYYKGKRIKMSRFASIASLLFIALLVILLGGCQRRESISLLQEDAAAQMTDTVGSYALSGGQSMQESATATAESGQSGDPALPAADTAADSASTGDLAPETEEMLPAGEDARSASTGEKTEKTAVICVDVSGAVVSPGVYRLPEGARVYEAIAAAGGFLPEADTDVLNQAARLEDEDQIRIPSATKEAAESAGDSSAENSGKNSGENTGQNSRDGSGESSSPSSENDTNAESKQQKSALYGLIREENQSSQETETAASESEGRININSASAEQLQTLPGIGESKAAAIIAYRETHGRFGSAEEIMQISGIKEGLYSKIKDKICTE